ncbi:pyruvate dehydrogenase (acetyl-transferring) E1 component subunit alpha [Sinomonas gamaensis]|jgi:pyruvate dehydrogenase E1 component alpha subunit|uniref:pyruvate dehydrogenase (acetyl-transferring) E1 component subunit alpha n=1 Tax=Sinomonas gamaensis TaxID=2565624 RepID=UPI001109C556|nr:pyruvate dehydrogenase (acetyl-transferring) E1 component subunit alpha [Sinomonas gamaensis]
MAGELPTTEFDEIPDELLDELEAIAHNRTEGHVQMVQLVDEEGHFHNGTRFSERARRLSRDELRGLYRDMAIIRRFDVEATALQRQGQLALWPPGRGQEAAQIGSGRATRPQDYIFPTYREHGVALTRGVELGELLRLFRGVSNGGWDPTETNFHLYTLVLAAQVPHAVGYAMGIQRDAARAKATGQEPGDPAAVVAYFGDGASSEGDIHESMVFAASFKAPVVFFCQNNQWAISIPTQVQSRIPLHNRAKGYGFPGLRVDGNDVLAVKAVTEWALERARSGKGPVLIEAYTYRQGAHTTADDPTKYRLTEDEQAWLEKDPIARFEKFLRAEGHADDEFFASVVDEGDALAAKSRKEVLAFEPPTLAGEMANVYAEAHPLVEEERAWHLQYEAGFADAETQEGGH